MSIVQKKVKEYSKKYFGDIPITMYFERRRLAMASFSGDCSGGIIYFDPDDVFYIKTDECLNELLLHELTHSIYMDHKIEFWQHLQHVLYSEGIIKEEKPFRLEQEGKYYNLYYGEKKLTHKEFGWYMYSEPDGYKYVCFVPSYNDKWKHGDKWRAITNRLFIYNELNELRRVKNSTYLVDDTGKFLSMRPIWEKFMKIYNIDSSFVLNLRDPYVRGNKNVIHINNYKPFIPKL